MLGRANGSGGGSGGTALRPIIAVPSPHDQETFDRIRYYIAHPPQEGSMVMEITPTVARMIIRNFNKLNRSVKPRKYISYARDMRNGNWRLTGAPISFTSERLADGQNRLYACIKANTAFKTHMLFGVEEDVFAYIDQGKSRDGADVFTIAGIKNARRMAGSVRWAYLLEIGRVKRHETIDPPELLRIYQTMYSSPDMQDFLPRARAINKVTLQPETMVAGLLYIFHKKNSHRALQFATAWEGNLWGGRFVAIDTMQKAIGRLKSATHIRLDETVRCALIIMAWNSFVSGRRVYKKDMAWTSDDEFPTILG